MKNDLIKMNVEDARAAFSAWSGPGRGAKELLDENEYSTYLFPSGEFYLSGDHQESLYSTDVFPDAMDYSHQDACELAMRALGIIRVSIVETHGSKYERMYVHTETKPTERQLQAIRELVRRGARDQITEFSWDVGGEVFNKLVGNRTTDLRAGLAQFEQTLSERGML